MERHQRLGGLTAEEILAASIAKDRPPSVDQLERTGHAWVRMADEHPESAGADVLRRDGQRLLDEAAAIRYSKG